MVRKEVTIRIPTKDAVIEVRIVPILATKESLWEISVLEAEEFGEASVQLQEGCSYEYIITKGYELKAIPGVLRPSKIKKSTGQIVTNTYVGTFTVEILDSNDNLACADFQLEVRSAKMDYREEYRQMLEEITERCTELLMTPNSHISQYFTTDFNAQSRTLYQQFTFIKSILDSTEFNESIHKILLAPVTSWKETGIERDIREVRRIDNKVIRQIVSKSNRVDLSERHYLRKILRSIPAKVQVNEKIETIDTPENQFIKYALSHFSAFCGNIISIEKNNDRLRTEATQLEDRLNHFLSHSIFKEISSKNRIPTNSPILQRKEGYREIFRIWLMFDLAAKLIWAGGDDVYAAGKKNIALLYEYWLFFKLIDLVADTFKIKPISADKLFEKTANGIGLKLIRGRHLSMEGIFENKIRRLKVRFNYNKTFPGKKTYPDAGSWTRDFTPDFTLSIWPCDLSEDIAENEELIVHIHFDAKYRSENGDKHKSDDLSKMHAYKDAIRRTEAAYVLYPGTLLFRKNKFHEILPGVGVFPVRPSRNNSGIEELRQFLTELAEHFLNRASQRERMSHKTYDIHRNSDTTKVNELLPENFGLNRSLLPEEVFVVVGYYKSEAHLNWILENGLYNTRIKEKEGSLYLNPQSTGAKYLILHDGQEMQTGRIFKLANNGPRIFSKRDLLKRAYPSSPTQSFYLVFEILKEIEEEFKDRIWNLSKLNRSINKFPFSISLAEIMGSLVK